MNYNKDTTSLSLLVVAILLVGSAFTFLPAFAATGGARTNASNPDCATPCVNNASPPTVEGVPYVVVGTGSTTGDTTFGVNVTNPASNAFAIMSITIEAPPSSEGFAFTGTPTCGTPSVLLGSLGAFSSTAVQCTAGTGSGLPPGFSQVIALGTLEAPSVVSSSTPTTGTFTSLVLDSSGTEETYPGSSFVEYSIASTTISISLSTGTATQYVAGSSAITLTATLSSGEVGVPLVFGFSNSSYTPISAYGKTFTSTISPSTTLSSGTTTTATWTPSDYASDSNVCPTCGDATAITVTIGNWPVVSDYGTTSTTTTYTVAGAADEVSFYFTVSGSTYATEYLTGNVNSTVTSTDYATPKTSDGVVSLSLADAYSNPVSLTSVTGVSISTTGDIFDTSTNAVEGSISCGTAAYDLPGSSSGVCSSTVTALSSLAFPLTANTGTDDYIQNMLYGTAASITATITTSTGSFSGTSGTIYTSNVDSQLERPQVYNYTIAAQTPATSVSGPAEGDALVQAGNLVDVVEYVNSPVQEGVPVTLNFCPGCAGTSTGYDTAVSGLVVSETLYTNSSGYVEEQEPINTTVATPTTPAATAVYNATMAAPLTTSVTNVIDAIGLSIPVYTTVGSIASLAVYIAADAPPTTGPNVQYANSAENPYYVDVAYVDSFGNLIPIGDAPITETQIALSATSGGLLTATNVYIAASSIATNSSTSFGAIELSVPSTLGVTVTVTATGVVSGVSVTGSASVTTVATSPTIVVTSPLPISTTIYSDSVETIFTGTANASIGLPNIDIVSIGYQVNGGTWQSVATAQLHNVTWSIPIILTEGLNTVIFNATDNESPAVTTVSPTYTVLVDTTTPTFSTMSVAPSGSAVNLNITSAEGDLNATSVSAWYNGTAISSSDITVTGTNSPGSSVTYAVTIYPPVIGTWSLTVNATTLAGLTGTTTAVVTTTSTTVVLPSTTFSFVTTPSECTLGTYNAVCVPVSNSQSTAATGVVFAVLHNAAGGTVEVATSTVTVAGLGSQTAYVVVNVPAGTYSVSIFVWSTTGTPISPPTTVSITVP